tara:strand:- start:6787 stop:7359 length:573 start_codon:yes stop_codon:yes gene_type:complete
MGKGGEEAYNSNQQQMITQMQGFADKFADRANIKQQQLDYLVKNRQAAINPYENITNQFANLPVATQAAEIQAEEADISLANTLDTMAATGQGAGGATALAQAALRSKKGIAANIEKQEVANAKSAAQGEDAVQRLQAEGEKFKFKTTEGRQMADINRTSNQLDQARNVELQAQTQLMQLQNDPAYTGED